MLMAEESGNLPVTPEKTMPSEGNSRRKSMGKASSSISGEKVLPHYLRASTGSCHDFCKYGRKHAFEAKARHPVPKRITKPLPEDQSATARVILPERKKTLVVRPKSSPISKTCSSDTPEIIKHEVSTRSPDGRNVFNISLDGQNPVNSEVLSGIKKISSSKVRPSPNSKTCLSESPKFTTQELSSSFANMEVSLKSVSSKSKETDTSAKHATSLKPKSLVQKPLSSSDPSGGLSGRRNSNIKTGKMTGPPKVSIKKVLASPKVSLASTRASLSPKPSVIRVAKKVLASPRVSMASPGALLSPKPSVSRVAKTVVASPRVSMASPRASLSPKPSLSRVAKKVVASARVSMASPRASLSPKSSLSRVASLNARKLKSLKVGSPMKHQGKTKNAEPEEPKIELKHTSNDMVQEKTLYIIKMETENKSLESDQNESCVIDSCQNESCVDESYQNERGVVESYQNERGVVESYQNESGVVESSPPPSSSLPKSLAASPSSSLHDEDDQENSEYTETATEEGSLSESEYDEIMSLEEEESMEGEHLRRLRKDGMVHSEDKGSQAMKLRFRRGKVVDIQSENNSPRRLKFRRGRVLGENTNLRVDGRRSLKKRGVDVEMMNDSKPGSQKVVLRHQDVQGKKDSQILFNNVIEQTASKLVESRKSKVKALVGAFETVISLQETKPPANTIT